MSDNEMICGPTLLGFGDMFEDEIGAVSRANPRKSIIQRPPPKKSKSQQPSSAQNQKTGSGKPSGLPRSATIREHGKALGKGRVTAAKSVKTMARAKQQLGRYVTQVARRKKVVVGEHGIIGNVEIGGDTCLGYVEIGAAAEKKLTPKAKAALRKHNAALAKADKAAKVLAQGAVKVRAKATELAKKLKTQKRLADSLRKKRTPGTQVRGVDLMATGIGEQVAEVFEEFYTAVGALPDPNNPGYLDDGTPDPAYDQTMMDAGSMDASAMDPFGAEVPGDSPAELPPAPPMDTYIADAASVGGIVYDGSKGYPEGYVGSYGLMYRTTDVNDGVPKTAGIDPTRHYGYVFGKFHDRGPEKGIPFGDNLAAGKWTHVHGRWILGGFRKGTWDASSGAEVVDASEAYASTTKNAPNGASYGPLIGNPAFQDFKGMRVDGKGVMFWFPQEAPDWLTFPLRQAAALTAKAEKEAADAQAKADALAQQQEQAAMAAEAARQEAELALAEKQAESEARIAEKRQASEAQQVLLQQAQTEQQQQQAETEATKSAMQLMLEQARMDMDQQKQMQQMRAQMEAQLAQEGGMPAGYGESDYEGVGPEVMDDGSPIPGADMMLDAGGEGYVESDVAPEYEE